MTLKGFLTDRQRRFLFAAAIILVSLTFIPFVPSTWLGFMDISIGSTDFTVGTLLALVSIFGAYLVSPWSRTL